MVVLINLSGVSSTRLITVQRPSNLDGNIEDRFHSGSLRNARLKKKKKKIKKKKKKQQSVY